MPSNLLVTGGAGYIGSHTAKLLRERGDQVWVLDNLCAGHRPAVPAGWLIEGDTRDERLVTKILRDHRISAVLHFAAFAQVGESVVDPAKYYDNNVVGTLSLLAAMQAAGVSQLVFSSTAATYGTPRENPITERSPQAPINPYGFTKLVIEQSLRDYSRAYQWGYAALRYFNAAGAAVDGTLGEDHAQETHLIPLVLQVALGKRPSIAIFGDDYDTPDGTCVRDYIHVDDLATAHAAALDRLQPGSGIEVNLGTGTGYSVREVIETCRRVTGRPIATTIAPRRPGDPATLVADATRARTVLDWTPRHSSLETIVETAWRWHVAHPDGWASETSSRA